MIKPHILQLKCDTSQIDVIFFGLIPTEEARNRFDVNHVSFDKFGAIILLNIYHVGKGM